MLLSAHFGKFKLKFIATINIAALLSLFNIASTTSSYWIKYIDNFSGSTHYAGMWRSCPNEGACQWKNGIVNHTHTTWSVLVRFLITFGTFCNCAIVGIFLTALIFKLGKKAQYTIRCMETGNASMMASLSSLLIGFCIFISSTCNYSLWLFVFSLILIVVTCNMLTRTYSAVYFQNLTYPELNCTKAIDENVKDIEEGVALTGEVESTDKSSKSDIEMIKVETGSSEALINEGADTEPQVQVVVASNEAKTEPEAATA